MIDQRTYWNGLPGDRWVHEQATLDLMLRPFGDAALRAARVATGERVLDVGCGCGDTSLQLAQVVGADGRVLGLDLSAPMVARARERSADRANLSFLEGDASREPLERAAFDLLFSRFGVMFFQDPVAAFAHLRDALGPEGRVAFVCWRSLRENPWAAVPFEAVAPVLGRPEPSVPNEPGPFAFSDRVRVEAVLEEAGFRDVSVEPVDGVNHFGATGTLDDAARDIARLGPVARLLVDRSEGDVASAVAAIRDVLPPFASSEGGADLAAGVWVVTAVNGPPPPYSGDRA
jgi:ubiquinone/menaquinone biosynthesis C-methylase UbiE